MLLTSAAPYLVATTNGRHSSFSMEEVLSRKDEQSAPSIFSFPQAPPSGLGTAAQEAAFARLSQEASRPPPGQAEKEELVRTSSAPSDLPLSQDPPVMQTSGLDWSGSVDGATLIQDLGQRGSNGSEEETCSFTFPPAARYRQVQSVPAMGRLSEDSPAPGFISDSLGASTSAFAATATQRTGSSLLATDETGNSVLSKSSSLTVPAEVPYESPFEAPQFQEEPIARPAQLPEVEEEKVIRSAATMPASQLESMLSPSLGFDSPPTVSGLAPRPIRRSPSSSIREKPHEDSRVSITDLKTGGRRQAGFKSLSVLERNGKPNLGEGQIASRSQEAQILSLIRQTLAQELMLGQEIPSSGIAGGKSASHEEPSVPPSEIFRALETVEQTLSQTPNTRSTALPSIPSGVPVNGEADVEEDDLMTSASLHQAIRKFQPGEETSRSPPRAPSLFNPKVLPDGSEWIIQSSELELGRCIGSGSFGEVFRAQWRHTDVAVKRLTNVTQAIVGDFTQEVALMSALKHPNVVQFLGACTSYPNLAIVTQFMPRGSLFNLLHRAKVQLDNRQKLWMALDVAKGMHYLHSCRPPIVHGDASSKNLLVDRDFSIRVGDFGMSRQRHKAMLSAKTQGEGTAEWSAPEILRGLPYTESCDVYSFGVILYELMTQQIPWAELSTIQVVGAVGWGNASLRIPASVSPPVRQLMLECMQRDPDKRPTFEEVIVSLRRLRQLEPSETSDCKPLNSESGSGINRAANAAAQLTISALKIPAPEEAPDVPAGSPLAKSTSLKSHRTV